MALGWKMTKLAWKVRLLGSAKCIRLSSGTYCDDGANKWPLDFVGSMFCRYQKYKNFFLAQVRTECPSVNTWSSSFSSTTDKHLGRNLWVVVEEKKLVFDVSSPHEHLIWPVCLKFEIIAFDILTFSDVKDVDPLLKTFQLFSFLLLCNLFESLKTSRY